MIRISITPAAFDAIADTLPLGSVAAEPEVNDKDERLVWLDVGLANRLRAMRGPGKSYSDVILRLAAAEALGRPKVDPIDELVRLVGEVEPTKPSATKRGSDRRPTGRRRR
jgi:hypothetical protein